MIAVLGVRGGTSRTITPPSGWSAINTVDSGTVLKGATFYKVASNNEPSYVFNFSGNASASGVISVYSGVDVLSITSNQSATTGSLTSTANPMVAPTRTTTASSSLVIGAFSIAASASSFTAGTGYSVRNSSYHTTGGTRTGVALEDMIQSSPGNVTPEMRTNNTGTFAAHTIVLSPGSSVSQSAYRWFANSTTAGAVGSPLASQNTATIAPTPGTPFRLRMLLGVSDLALGTDNSFRLEYKFTASESCDATGGFLEVTATSPIRYYDNSGVADGANLVTSVDDPVRSGVTKVSQTYEETNNFSVATTIPVGQDGMWDFALTTHSDAESGLYCLRAARDHGGSLESYDAVPALIIPESGKDLEMENYRLFQNADSATPGSPLAPINSQATLTATGDQFRLRSNVFKKGGFKSVSGGELHSCGITYSGKAYCWGDGQHGRLGHNSTGNSNIPVAVNTSGAFAGKTVKTIATGSWHSCAIASDDQAYCWGSDLYGRLGTNGSGDKSVPTPVYAAGALAGKTLKTLMIGNSHACVIANDDLAYCWGDGYYGRLGDNTGADRYVPTAVYTGGVLAGKTIKQITGGDWHTCAIASDDKVYCWGDGTFGQLGQGSFSGSNAPVAVDMNGALAGKTVKSISAGYYHTCAIASDDQAYCWGAGDYGHLGNNNPTHSNVPVAVSTSGALAGKTLKSLGSGGWHNCAVASDNRLYCWGRNDFGQVGSVGSGNSNVPVAVNTSGILSGKDMRAMDGGLTHSCAIDIDNVAYCWGSGTSGELGNNTTSNSSVPVFVHTTGVIPSQSGISLGRLAMKLQYAAKTESSCAVQTGYADITNSSPISYHDNSSVTNGALISSTGNDPIVSIPADTQSYHDILGGISNPLAIADNKSGLWDFSLKDNGAQPDTTYCIRAVRYDGTELSRYRNLPEIKTAIASSGSGPTLDQQLRGGQSVIDGVKGPFTW